jgi:putative ABC transport system substrate-binding protein
MKVVSSQWSVVSESIFRIALSAMLLVFYFPAQAQQPKTPRIGMLVTGSVSTNKSRDDAFRQGLRELGYIEGKNIVIESRYAEGERDRIPELAAELVRLKVDVLVVAGGTSTTLPVKKATSSIPIVFTNVSDPVGAGLVANLARPGGNVTGLSTVSQDLSGKRLELLKEVVPKALRVAVLWNPGPADENEVKQIEVAARAFGVKLQSLRDPNEFRGSYAAMKRETANALVLIQGSFTLFHRQQLAELAAKNRLPSMCESSSWTDDGCLLSYGPDSSYQWRRAATYVDKILKGAKPADLPVEQPKKFEFVVNLKTAKQIGLTIPPNVLARADRVIR